MEVDWNSPVGDLDGSKCPAESVHAHENGRETYQQELDPLEPQFTLFRRRGVTHFPISPRLEKRNSSNFIVVLFYWLYSKRTSERRNKRDERVIAR